jgi:hypothetical protein
MAQKLKKFIAKFDKAGKYKYEKVSQRKVTYWAYSREGARQWFDRERIRYEIVYPR